MTKEKAKMIANGLNTDYGREELRRCFIEGLQEALADPKTDEFNRILCEVALKQNLFGESPEPWEKNPYEWSFEKQMDEQG